MGRLLVTLLQTVRAELVPKVGTRVLTKAVAGVWTKVVAEIGARVGAGVVAEPVPEVGVGAGVSARFLVEKALPIVL